MAGGLTNDIRFRILGDATSLQRATQAAAGHLDSVAGKLQAVGRRLTVGVTAPLAALGGAAFKAASDVVEATSKVEAVFGNQADTVKQWARTTTEAYRVSRREALEAAGTFGNLFTAMGLTDEASAEMATQLVELGGDLASFNNIRTDEALEKLRSGLVGEVEPLRALGVQLSAAVVEMKAFEMGLENADGTLSESAKAQARYELILEQTVTAQGDAARTAETAAGRMGELRASFDDLKAEIGEQLLPIGEQLMDWLSDLIDGWNRLDPELQEAITKFGLVAAAAGPAILGLRGILMALNFIIAHPIIVFLGLLAAALAMVAMGTTDPIEAFKKFGEGWTDLAELIKENWTGIKQHMRHVIADIIDILNVGIGALNQYAEYVTTGGLGILPFVNVPNIPNIPNPYSDVFKNTFAEERGVFGGFNKAPPLPNNSSLWINPNVSPSGLAALGHGTVIVQIGDQAVEDVVVKATNSARSRGRID